MEDEKIKKAVREGYAKVAKNQSSCCGPQSNSCCGPSTASRISKGIGYSDEDLSSVPDGADLGLGCGNPVALAELKEGDVVLDLGSGAGFDAFLAAARVGASGKVIGVDMTPEMIEKARGNIAKGSYKNVEFRLGEIEYLPVADNSVDKIISNCVINLVPNKKKAFAEAFRVLKPGGKLMVSDIVLTGELPDVIKNSVAAYVGCLSGASQLNDYLACIKEAGFEKVEVVTEKHFPVDYMLNDATAQTIYGKPLEFAKQAAKKIEEAVASVNVSAVKPL